MHLHQKYLFRLFHREQDLKLNHFWYYKKRKRMHRNVSTCAYTFLIYIFAKILAHDIIFRLLIIFTSLSKFNMHVFFFFLWNVVSCICHDHENTSIYYFFSTGKNTCLIFSLKEHWTFCRSLSFSALFYMYTEEKV